MCLFAFSCRNSGPISLDIQVSIAYIITAFVLSSGARSGLCKPWRAFYVDKQPGISYIMGANPAAIRDGKTGEATTPKARLSPSFALSYGWGPFSGWGLAFGTTFTGE